MGRSLVSVPFLPGTEGVSLLCLGSSVYCSGYGLLALMGGPFGKLMGNRARVDGGFFVVGLCLVDAGSVFIGLHCAFSIIRIRLSQMILIF